MDRLLGKRRAEDEKGQKQFKVEDMIHAVTCLRKDKEWEGIN